jgi:PhzF family phenazine biosynthesis protein
VPETVHLHLVDAFATTLQRQRRRRRDRCRQTHRSQQMQRIAREVNASETAFLSRANDLHQPTRIRWFTPTIEVDFCGHATLAAMHALAECQRL